MTSGALLKFDGLKDLRHSRRLSDSLAPHRDHVRVTHWRFRRGGKRGAERMYRAIDRNDFGHLPGLKLLRSATPPFRARPFLRGPLKFQAVESRTEKFGLRRESGRRPFIIHGKRAEADAIQPDVRQPVCDAPQSLQCERKVNGAGAITNKVED